MQDRGILNKRSILKDAINVRQFKKQLYNARKILERASQCLGCYKMLKGQKKTKKKYVGWGS